MLAAAANALVRALARAGLRGVSRTCSHARSTVRSATPAGRRSRASPRRGASRCGDALPTGGIAARSARAAARAPPRFDAGAKRRALRRLAARDHPRLQVPNGGGCSPRRSPRLMRVGGRRRPRRRRRRRARPAASAARSPARLQSGRRPGAAPRTAGLARAPPRAGTARRRPTLPAARRHANVRGAFALRAPLLALVARRALGARLRRPHRRPR